MRTGAANDATTSSPGEAGRSRFDRGPLGLLGRTLVDEGIGGRHGSSSSTLMGLAPRPSVQATPFAMPTGNSGRMKPIRGSPLCQAPPW
jgi:hypothetical protein